MSGTTRIRFEHLPDELKGRLEARVARLGYLGEFFQVAAHQPGALAGFIDFTEALKQAVPDRLVESIALTIASASGNAYERVQHERLALKLGFTEAEVRALVDGRAESPEFAAEELLAVELARQVRTAAGGRCPAYDELEQQVGEEVAVGCLMTAVRYLAHATMANTWGLAAPVASPLEAEPGRV
jgi:alkylhydroperoxidase family enzyme